MLTKRVVGVYNEDGLDIDALALGPSEGRLKLIDCTLLEAALGIGVGIHDGDLGEVPKVQLEAAVDGPAGQDAIARVSNGPGEHHVQGSRRRGDLYEVGGDGLVRPQVLV